MKLRTVLPILTAICAVAPALPALAQNQQGNQLLIVAADTQSVPDISIRFGLFDEQHQPIGDVQPADIAASVDGKPVTSTLDLAAESRELAVVVVADFSAAMNDQPVAGRTRVGAMAEQIKRMADLLSPAKTPISLVAFDDQAQVTLNWSSNGDDLRSAVDTLASKPLAEPAEDRPYALGAAIKLGLAQFTRPIPQFELDQRPRALLIYSAGAPGRTLDPQTLRDAVEQLAPNRPSITFVGLGSGNPGEFTSRPGNPESLRQAARALPGATFLPLYAADPRALLEQRGAIDRQYAQIVSAQQLYRLILHTQSLVAGRHRIDLSARGAGASTVLQIGDLPPRLNLHLPAPVLQNRTQLSIEILYSQRPIRQVKYLLEGQTLGVATTGPDFALALDVGDLFKTGQPLGSAPEPDKQYRLVAVATDTSGLSRSSSEALVTFVPPPSAPNVSLFLLAAIGVSVLVVVAAVSIAKLRAKQAVLEHPPIGQFEAVDPLAGRTVIALPSDDRTSYGVTAPRVVIVSGMASKSFKLQQGRQCTVGREPLHDISLGNHQVSRNHARLTLVAGGVELTDLGSANGTFVGEQKRRLEPDQPRVVAFGDVFWIGPEIKLCVEQ
jgi:hypothetical protein